MNPSAMDIEKAIKRTYARNVYVFPNNKNIILAAEQAKELVEGDTDIRVHVIPTQSITQGVAAAIAFDPDSSAEENVQAMTEAYQSVKSGSVTYAVRDTVISGREIHQGDFMGMEEGSIAVNGPSLNEVTDGLIDAMMKDDGDYITIFYGKDVSEEDAKALAKRTEERYEDADVVVQYGGQPLYYYFISVE